jgi:hypothetical protein
MGARPGQARAPRGLKRPVHRPGASLGRTRQRPSSAPLHPPSPSTGPPSLLFATQLWDIEVPDDEGGIAVPILNTPHPDETPTQTEAPNGSRTTAASTRHPDEVTTAPEEGKRRAVGRQPMA